MQSRILPVAIAGGMLLITVVAAGQSPAYRAPRTADGKPDLNGIWQALNTANWDLEAHGAATGPVPLLGALFAIPPGQSVVDGDVIPYLPAALAKRNENKANWYKLDPEVRCYLPGVPRATYLPHPLQIVQGPTSLVIAYEYDNAVRPINMGPPTKSPGETWMGWSNGRWEGDTLVVDVTSQNDQTWFDRAGNYHSEAIHVVERYTPRSADTLLYEATIDDAKVFSRPWKISMPLYRRAEKNAKLLEYRCVEFTEELIYGDLRKKSD